MAAVGALDCRPYAIFAGVADLRFTKMQGLGNDYVYLNCLEGEPEDLPGLARRMSDRHFGIGADGLICICPSEQADFRMRIFNADGSEGEMCGNGIRCVGKYVHDMGLTGKTALRIETLAGVRELWLHCAEGAVSAVTVDMGAPQVEPPRRITVRGSEFRVTPVRMGNPHTVVFLEEINSLDLPALGPGFEHHPDFPGRTNTEFVQPLSPDRLRMRVWERGSGETLACGTGACAALAAAVSAGLCGREAAVELPGGELRIIWNGGDGHIYMTGPAVTVFNGEYQINEKDAKEQKS